MKYRKKVLTSESGATLKSICLELSARYKPSNQLYLSNINGTSKDKNDLGFISSILTEEGALKRSK